MLTKLLKLVLSTKWQRNLAYFRDLAERIDQVEITADRAAQGLAALRLRPDTLKHPHPRLENHEFRIRSQWGEDGILHHLFSTVGIHSRSFVEFGIQSGRECNAAHLALSEGWSGLFLEGDCRLAAWAREYYHRMLGPERDRVIIEHAFITTENINALLRNHSPEAIDLLSIDIDGNDYWVWKAVTAVTPRVVVVEYNAALGPWRSITIPYWPTFRRSALGDGMYYGASLTALTRLATQKGYALVGCGSNGINAFFVRRDFISSALPEVPVSEAYRPHFGLSRHSKLSLDEQFALVSDLPFESVVAS